MRNRLLYLILQFVILLSIFATYPVFASAAAEPLFSVSLSADALQPGDSFSVVLTANREDISAFLMTVTYDDSVEQVKAEFSESATNDHTLISVEDRKATLVYAASSGGKLAETEQITLRFRTNAETAVSSTAIHLEITDAADPSAAPLLTAPETHTLEAVFVPKPSADSALLSLVPPIGTLEPAFDPGILNYTLEVPFTCTALEFEAESAEGGRVQVNRKNLGAGGSTVDFRFTVTAADGASKSVYTVSVTRLPKEASASAPKPTGTKNSDSENRTDGGEENTESNPLPEESSAAADSLQPVVRVSAAAHTANTGEKLFTAVIALFSAGAGMLLVVLVQYLIGSKDKNNTL